MHLSRIYLKNFKAFDTLEFDLSPRINLIIDGGNAGAGKTSILEGIALACGGMFLNVVGVKPNNITQNDIKIIIPDNPPTNMSFCNPCIIGCSLAIGDKEFSWHRIKEDGTSSTNMDDKNVCKYFKDLTNQPNSNLPLISFQSNERVCNIKNGDFGYEIKEKLDDRRCGYIGCLNTSKIQPIQQWCLKQEVMMSHKGKIREYETFKNIVTLFMKEVNGLKETPSLYYSPAFNELVYKDKFMEMPISKLGSGYQSLLWMVMDLAYRVCLLNPEIGNLSQIEGIVLIDDIELHLNPRQPSNILQALSKTFENVQFIVTTHSSIVASSFKEANILYLKEDHSIENLSME
jgi:predicted ATP-binding protein involved in virulence